MHHCTMLACKSLRAPVKAIESVDACIEMCTLHLNGWIGSGTSALNTTSIRLRHENS